MWCQIEAIRHHNPLHEDFVWCQIEAIRHHIPLLKISVWCRIAPIWHHKFPGIKFVVPNSRYLNLISFSVRDAKHTNFVEFRSFKIIYRRYAGLYFCICVDVSDNNLFYLEAIHNFVEVLNDYFRNVCELDLVFNFYKVYTIVDEMFLAGELRETSQTKVLKQLMMLNSLE